MSLSIEKSENFQKEYTVWLKKLEKIQNENAKKEISNMLGSLLKTVRLLDGCHNDLGVTNRISANSSEFRQAILELRTSIHKRFQEIESVEQL